jgi:DNA-binding MarR family transcriptional regulator
MTRRDLAATTGCYCLAARRAARRLTRLYETRLRPVGLRATQFSILAALALKGPTRVGELAALLGLERTTLTRSAALLARRGWVRAARAPDARAHPLRITPAGRRKLEAALPAWKAAQDCVGRTHKEAPWAEYGFSSAPRRARSSSHPRGSAIGGTSAGRTSPGGKFTT